MKIYSTQEAGNKLDEILRWVRAGERVVLADHGKDVAEILPASEAREAVLRQLEEEGILSTPGQPRDLDFEPLAERPGALARFLELRG